MALNSSSLKPFWDFTVLIRSKVVPSNDPNLLHSTGNAAQSPFVIAAKRAGIKVVPSIINFVVLTSAWSAGNSVLLGSSRTLYGKSQLLGGLFPLSCCFRYRLCGSFQRLLECSTPKDGCKKYANSEILGNRHGTRRSRTENISPNQSDGYSLCGSHFHQHVHRFRLYDAFGWG
jgi:hypothetical protein